jgi:hypothetical protein
MAAGLEIAGKPVGVEALVGAARAGGNEVRQPLGVLQPGRAWRKPLVPHRVDVLQPLGDAHENRQVGVGQPQPLSGRFPSLAQAVADDDQPAVTQGLLEQ